MAAVRAQWLSLHSQTLPEMAIGQSIWAGKAESDT